MIVGTRRFTKAAWWWLLVVLWWAGTAAAQGTDPGSRTTGEEFAAVEQAEFSAPLDEGSGAEARSHQGLWVALATLAATGLAGVMVRYPRTRPWRSVSMLVSLVTLGFWLGGCPCPISGLQATVLTALGAETHGYGVVWFLGLLPITYVFGKVWCGWVCHLGALQEFLHRQNHVAFLDGDRAQLAMRYLRHLFLGALLVQLVWTRENLFVHIDPFKVAFNLRSYYLTGWLLLGLLLLSALYVHRPFCRAVCPIGLVLGWVGRLPGALRLATDTSCRTCGRCGSRCQLHAIDAQVRVSSEDCVLCGNCLNACKSLSMHPTHTRPARPVSQAVPGPASHGATE